jgi:putative phosphoribosyl transferase
VQDVVVQFRDRSDAGRALANALLGKVRPDAVVFGLARGGVPVAYEVARTLGAPLEVLVVRKLGVPGDEELAMGAIGPGGTRVLNEDVIRRLGIPPRAIERVAERERSEAKRRECAYRQGLPQRDVRDRHAIVIDDGLATGASMRAAVASLRVGNAARITAAVPIGSAESCDELRRDTDEVLCLTVTERLIAVARFYRDFSQTTDDEVSEILARASRITRSA